ncbi:MAG: hypothetical protein ABJN36_07615 [Cyclobacteriaceae bacterium]
MKKYLLKALDFISQVISVLRLKIGKVDNVEESTKKYDDLAPRDHLTKDNEYIKALEWALSNEKIRNIGVTGPYGSGKSTILHSFKKLNPDHKYLEISLASFSQNGVSQNAGDKSDHINRLLERSILQQIFYRENPENIPQSRFRRLQRVKKPRTWIWSALTLLWLLSTFGLFYQPTFSSILSYCIPDFVRWIFLGLFLIGSVVLFYHLRILLKELSFSKLNVLKGDIELARKIDSSILNKYMDEILYYFEVGQYNVVLIEDLDRFESTDILTKLREINLLLNQAEQIKRKPVVFIYAIKDDFFDLKNARTKFFDFILPIIPIINYSNSKEELIKKLPARLISPQLLRTVSLYIEDMRTLKNIVNEFNVYRNTLDMPLEPDKMFAIMVYKNLYPKDFSELHVKKGIVHSAFELKNDIKEKKKAKIEEKVEIAQDKLQALGQESSSNIYGLRLQYIGELVARASAHGSIVRLRTESNINYTVADLTEGDNFEILVNSKSIRVQNHQQFNSIGSFTDIEQAVNPDFTYQERKGIIEERAKGKIKDYKQQLKDLTAEGGFISRQKLYELDLSRTEWEELIPDFKTKSLLRLLIQNGYIDENYPDYISIFYSGSVTRMDKEFILSVQNQRGLPFEHELKHVEEIISTLEIAEFEHDEILNFDLLNYLVSRSSFYNQQVKSVIKVLAKDNSFNRNFLFVFWEEKVESVEKFMSVLVDNWPKFWIAVEEADIDDNLRIQFIGDILISLNDDSLLRIDEAIDQRFSKFISQDKDFIRSYEKHHRLDQIKSSIKVLDVNFRVLDVDGQDSDLFDFIYENNLYSINREMINLILLRKSEDGKEFIKQTEVSNYTCIRDSGCSLLLEYVDENLEVYVNNVILGVEKIDEKVDYLILLLNSENISTEQKFAIIERQESKIEDLVEVKDYDLWAPLFKESKITPKWESVLRYFEKSDSDELDNSLIHFLNQPSNFNPLSDTKILDKIISEKKQKALCRSILLSTGISDPAYSVLVKSIPYVYSSFAFEGLSKIRVEAIMRERLLTLTAKNYELLRDNFRPLHIDLVVTFLNEFNTNIEEFVVDETDLSHILGNKKLSPQSRANTIRAVQWGEYTLDDELSDAILELLNEVDDLSIDLVDIVEVFNQSDNTQLKLEFLVNRMSELTIEQVSELLSFMPKDYRKITEKRKRPTFDKSELHLKLALGLKQRGLITNFYEKDDIIRIIANY